MDGNSLSMGSKFTGDGAVDEKDEMYYFLDFVQFRVSPRHSISRTSQWLHLLQFRFFKEIGVSDTLFKNDRQERVIDLPDISRDMFKGLLLVMYPFTRTAQTYDEWLGALHLETMWDLPDVRSTLQLTTNTRSLERILLGASSSHTTAKKHKLGSWLRDGYIQLIQGKDINIDDLRSSSNSDPLDWETISRLVQAQSLFKRRPTEPVIIQEEFEACSRQKGSHLKWGYNPAYCCSIHNSAEVCVNRVFQEELIKVVSKLPLQSFAGERLALNTEDPFPRTNELGPRISLESHLGRVTTQPIFLASILQNSSVIPCYATDLFCPYTWFPGNYTENSHEGRFDLLPYSPEQMEWILTSHGNIPPGRQPISGGYDEEGRELYHALAALPPDEGLKVPGQTGEHL
ncbi:hypothetical protein CPB83DRAFT_908881 [Crepidotus variabilis]|uniref:BTB domain-containing protein n=1 Tax=Crepidotus variabilis TaxID=179855 RepID=A0A9P6EB21_9AGAR|nr:hypothetical protein CPB83DRAFT_908881 [Crepidotus variabilis]